MIDQTKTAAERQGWIVLALLAVALVAGGGGSPAPLPEMAVEIAFAVLVPVWLWLSSDPLLRTVPVGARVVAGLVLLVPLAQLIPLPPPIWQALPGREIERDALALIAAENTWRPVALAPARTVAAFLAMVPAAAMMIMVTTLSPAMRWRLVGLVAGFGILTLLIGAAQMSAGTVSPLYFFGADAAILTGFQANRNSTADVLLIAMIAAPAAIRHLARSRREPPGRPAVWLMAGAMAALLALGVVLTGSRTGVMLLVVALIANGVILRPWLSISAKGLGLAALALLLAGAALWHNPVIERTIQRFDFAQEARPDLWRDSLYVARSHAPLGVGMGGFFPAYIADERLETIGQTVPNRAHNDFLELAIEAGLPGLLALSLCGAIVLRAAARQLRESRRNEAHILVIFALFVLAIGILHSLVDYPLRSMSLACLIAACVGLIFPAVTDLADRADLRSIDKTA
ncbi:MAG: O-antigen ligase family protein [Sphingomonadales bacterium]|nr:O-antigen ligase family protein [Sphingomonadales bacterium]